jgi:acetylornithine deacetylase/succinyl-diaminopimelate desuccinylase-like protein
MRGEQVADAHRLRREIRRLVRDGERQALEWLRLLVSVDSTAPGERPAQRLLAEIATSAGLRPQLLDADPDSTLAKHPRFVHTGLPYQGRPNCVITLPGATGRPLVANAHIDTVAPGDGWTRNPYGELVGDRLYGLGACDTKGSLVAALLAATVLQHLGEPPPAPPIYGGTPASR